ncbi:hypothetical protein BGX29_011108 [Mortierella sp. GBA35]|nr:hypothetical protein BGX29_011108 [Mortierella sp. GBA35]
MTTTRRTNSSSSVTGTVSNLNSNNLLEIRRHQYELGHQTLSTLPLTSSSTLSANNINSSNRSTTSQTTPLEVDDRIHFRLLDGIYFSAPPRLPRHDDDLGMDSPPQQPSQNRSELQYINTQDTTFSNQEDEYMRDNNAMEDLDFGDVSEQHHTMYNGQGDEFASVVFRRRSNHPELIEEEVEDEDRRRHGQSSHHHSSQQNDDSDDDDEEDGIDQVMEAHRHSDALARSPSSSLPSHLEQPQHAQLSPRSAAALASMFTMDRSSWPQPLISSSITSNLTTMSQPGAQSEYDNNPYFRRPGSSYHAQADNNRHMDTTSPSHSRQTSMPDHPLWQSTTGPGNAFRPRSISTQYESADHSTSNTRHQHGRRFSTDSRGCGEVNDALSTEMQGDVWPLKFDMYYADGGEFNAAHSVENLFKNDSSVYCSRRPTNINICLKLAQPHQTFVLTQFKAKAPTTGFTAPCKEGLIFISHEPIRLENTTFFDNMTRQMYNEHMETVKRQPRLGQMHPNPGPDADALIPAAFFRLSGPDETCTVDFTPNRSGRYVLIKLLRSRCTNSLQRPENIDLQYLGLIGFTGARSFASGGLL